MSILFIGEHSRSHPQNAFLLNNELQQMQKIKRKRQQKYRQDLQQQVKQKNERKHHQKMRDIEMDMKYEQVFYQQFSQKRNNNQHLRYYTEQKQESNKKEKERYQQIKYPQTDKPKRKEWLPSLKTQQKNNQRYNRYNPEENDNNYHSKLRVGTQNIYNKSSILNDEHCIDDSQARLQKLRAFENNKIKEVYEMMEKSIKILNEQEQMEIQQISERMKPIKIELNHGKKEKFKNRWHNNFTEPKQDFYRLPNIHRSYNAKVINHPNKNILEDDINWKQWYAKEKLKQLQTIYQKQFMNEQVRSRMETQNYRSVTPGFYRSKYH